MKEKIIAAIALLVGSAAIMIGCHNTPSTAPEQVAGSSDPYAYLRVDSFDAGTGTPEIPTFKDVLSTEFSGLVAQNAYALQPCDSLHRPIDGSDQHLDSIPPFVRDSSGRLLGILIGRHFGTTTLGSHRSLIASLALSTAQDSLVRVNFATYRSCATNAAASYGANRRALYVSLLDSLKGVHDALIAGTISRESASARAERLTGSYRTSARKLSTDYAAATSACSRSFKNAVANLLNAGQLAVWNRDLR